MRGATVAGIVLIVALGPGSACGGSTSAGARQATPAAAAAPSATPSAVPSPQLRAVLVATQLVVGTDRFPIGIVDQNTQVADAAVHVRVFSGSGSSAQLKGEADAPYRGEGLEGHGLYVARFRFDVPGAWLAEVSARRPDGSQGTTSLPFAVALGSAVPMVGQAAPRSNSVTAASVPDVSYIDSGQPPDDMHAISIADAIAQHRPTLVVFATPAFCTSATCGPQVHAVQALEPAYRDRLTFIHIEVYRNFKPDPARRQVSPTVLEWNLETEPWVFLIDRQGRIASVFEGAAASDELGQAVDQMLAAG